VTGHRYKLTNHMPATARNVAVALDKAVLRPSVPTWDEIPPASSVSFVCQPAVGQVPLLITFARRAEEPMADPCTRRDIHAGIAVVDHHFLDCKGRADMSSTRKAWRS
jgi:hypothetical protein